MADKIIQLQSADGIDNLFPVTKCDLLWTNSNVSSAFSAQTVSVDLSKYKMCYIEFYWSTGDGSRMHAIMPVGVGGIVNGIYNAKVYRNFSTSTTGVTFAAGNQASSATGTMVTANGVCIPYKIYGLA